MKSSLVSFPSPKYELALRGLIAATFTPLRADRSVDLDRIAPLVELVLGQGANGLYVLGSTGEGPSLTTAERKQTAESFVAAAKRRVPVVIQVGHASIAESRGLAAHAQEIGADAISATPPSYFKPENMGVLVASMAEIAAAAPKLPFYYYNLPSVTGVRFDMSEFLAQAGAVIPTLHGIKFSDAQIHEMQACVECDHGRYDILFGHDEMLLSGYVAGARGFVGTTFNFAAPIFRRVIGACETGDLATAAAEQRRAARMIEVIIRRAGRGGLKAVMEMIGCDCGPNRLPIVTCPPEARTRLRTELSDLGFFEWLK